MKQWLKEFIHNCIVHPLMMVLPYDKATRLHDINANYTFGLENRYGQQPRPLGRGLQKPS